MNCGNVYGCYGNVYGCYGDRYGDRYVCICGLSIWEQTCVCPSCGRELASMFTPVFAPAPVAAPAPVFAPAPVAAPAPVFAPAPVAAPAPAPESVVAAALRIQKWWVSRQKVTDHHGKEALELLTPGVSTAVKTQPQRAGAGPRGGRRGGRKATTRASAGAPKRGRAKGGRGKPRGLCPWIHDPQLKPSDGDHELSWTAKTMVDGKPVIGPDGNPLMRKTVVLVRLNGDRITHIKFRVTGAPMKWMNRLEAGTDGAGLFKVADMAYAKYRVLSN